MELLEWFLNLFIKKQASKIKNDAYLELKKVNTSYLNAKYRNEKYLSKYSCKRRYTKA